MRFTERERVNCSTCGGDCVEICEYSGQRVSGGLITTKESIEELRARRPLLKLQRRQREQLLELIDEAEKIGAWLWTESTSSRVSARGCDYPDNSISQAVAVLRRERAKWRRPKELRDLLTGKNAHCYDEMYRFVWIVRYPNEFIDEIQQLWRVVSDLMMSMHGETDEAV